MSVVNEKESIPMNTKLSGLVDPLEVRTRIIGELTARLNDRGISVLWLPSRCTQRKFPYNTNIRHEDEMGEDLDLKSIDELCDEFKASGSDIVLLFHDVDGPHKGSQMIFYDSRTMY